MEKNTNLLQETKNGLLLVMDDSYCCYFYPNDVFKIIDDPYGILKITSVYYNFRGGYNFD